jgi:DNA primase
MKTVLDVLDDHMVDYSWVNDDNVTYECPFCGKGAGHFTVSTSKALFNCYKCGERGHIDMLFPGELDKATNKILSFTAKREEKQYELKLEEIELPKRYSVTKRVKDYITSRGLPLSVLDDWDIYLTRQFPYRNRLVLPVRVEGVNVGFQARTLFKGQRPRYLSPKGVNLRSYLYGIDQVRRNEYIVLVEGPFDAIRLQDSGFPAVALFGKKITRNQLELLKLKRPGQIIIMLDSDVVMMDAITLMEELNPIFPTKVAVLDEGDPGDLDRGAAWRYIESATNDVFMIKRKKLESAFRK